MTDTPRKILITITDKHVAPRFDLTTEVLVAHIDVRGRVVEQQTMVLPSASEEDLCHLILTENMDAVICSGIEDEYYQYLKWKRVEVLDSIIGPYATALNRYAAGKLHAGDILFNTKKDTEGEGSQRHDQPC